MRQLTLHPQARTELVNSARYYAQQAPGLGDDFLAEFSHTTERILSHPEASRTIYQNVRAARVQRFPFNVLYRIEEEQIFVLAVMHQRRKPDYWKNRL